MNVFPIDANIEIAGIEFVEDINEKLYTYDINTNTNYNSVAESLSDLKGMKAIANFLMKEMINDKKKLKEKSNNIIIWWKKY